MVTFSDDEDGLDLGLDDPPPAKAKAKQESNQSAGMADSLFGKSSSVEKHLQRPGTGGSQREFNISAGLSSSGKQRKQSDDDDDIFGSYAPSAISSRPGTGRSVRFEDEEKGPRRPATADAATLGADDDWLGLGSDKSQKKRPLGLASTTDFSSSGLDDDWLDMASSRPKTAPSAQLDKAAPVTGFGKKPPRTPEKKPAVASKMGADDDWLKDLTAKVDDETEFTSNPRLSSRRLSSDKILSRQSSLDSAGSNSKRGPLVKQASADSVSSKKVPVGGQSSADDWLGLGDEKPIEEVKPAVNKTVNKASKPPVDTDTDWLGLGASAPSKDDDTEQWIKTAKLRRQKSSDSILGDGSKASGTFSLVNQQEKASTLPWETPTTTPSATLEVRPAATSVFDLNKPLPNKPAASVPSAVSSQPPFQPMFGAAAPVAIPIAPPTDPASWNQEQESLVQQHRVQMEQMQQQFNQMMDVRRQQQQAALEQQKKLAEEAFMLQQQQIQASISGISPSPVFPTGLTATKQSEIQLDNVELEGKVRRLEHEKSHLESLVESIKKRHQEELTAIDTSNKARILMVEESYQRREFRLREEIEQLSSESLTKLRHAEEEKTRMLAAQYQKVDELERCRSMDIDRLRAKHREEMERVKQDHALAIEVLRKSKEQELEGLLSTTNNPQSLQFLMEQMKQSAAGLTALQFNIGKSHKVTLDERELSMNSRDQQLKVLQECLERQQDENDKERSRLQELIAKMEIQLREQERQLHQEKWTVSQEKSKLAGLQAAVDQERTLLNDQLSQERAQLNRAKDSFLAEQRTAMVQLADERRLLAEERSQLTVNQRVAAERDQEESIKLSQGSAKYEGLMESLEKEREEIEKRARSVSAQEAKQAAEQKALEREQEMVRSEQERLGEMAQKIQKEMNSIETFSKDCVEKERDGRQALMESRRLDTANQARLSEISARLEELKMAEKRFAEERLQLARERKQIDSLKSMQLCAGCKQPVTRNPYFSLSTPILRNRTSPSFVGVVAPQQLDLTDPHILQYKIQADQDSDFLNEESIYLDALKFSPYHNK
ncbi:fas-binding factor 1 homolog isoform X2 [Watersipora subatra]